MFKVYNAIWVYAMAWFVIVIHYQHQVVLKREEPHSTGIASQGRCVMQIFEIGGSRIWKQISLGTRKHLGITFDLFFN